MSNDGVKNGWRNYRFPIFVLSGIVLGAVIGLVVGEQAAVLKPLGSLFINLSLIHI